MLSVVSIVTIAVAVLAAVIDVRTHRIPNLLTFGSAIAGLLYHGITGGLPGVVWALAACAIGLALFFPFFVLGGMGAGDVKLLAALGAWLGPSGALRLAAATALAGGLVAIAVTLHSRYLRTAIRNLLLLSTHWRV